jgi:hypothetical protein
MKKELKMANKKDLEGSGSGIFEILSPRSAGGTGTNNENPQPE